MSAQVASGRKVGPVVRRGETADGPFSLAPRPFSSTSDQGTSVEGNDAESVRSLAVLRAIAAFFATTAVLDVRASVLTFFEELVGRDRPAITMK